LTARTTNIELIQPVRYKVWGWPAVINFFLCGMASGFYVIIFFENTLYRETLNTLQLGIFKILSPVLVIIGSLNMIFKDGKILRARYLLHNLRSSWMSRETLLIGFFILSSVLDWLFPNLALYILAATAAVLLILSQGFIVYRAKAMIFWNMPVLPIQFLTSGFASGYGLLSLVTAIFKLNPVPDILKIGLTFVIINMLVWLIYLYSHRDFTFQKATEVFRRPIFLILIVGMGHLIPALLLLIMIATGVDNGVKFQYILSFLIGIFIIAGGIGQKAGIIMVANFLRGIVMGQTKTNKLSMNQSLNNGNRV
jgi:formate-dependent nitrite reductase membrane component NrfD